MGCASLEFIKRGASVIATDLMSNAVELTRWYFDIEGAQSEAVYAANVLDWQFKDNSFDAI